MMDHLPTALYIVLFLATLLAPLRWSIIAFLLLSNIDLGSLNSSIGLLNTAKAMLLPVILLWRFRAWAGHERTIAAPVAWSLLVVYVAFASTWSLYPAYALKLIGHMLGSLVICLALLRASKGRFLSQQTILPVALGTLAIAFLHWRFLHDWGGEPERFTTFAGAQAFAAFATALYCAALAFKRIQWPVRLALCSALALAVLWNGSRIWVIGICLSTFSAVLVSRVPSWVKLITCGLALVACALLVLAAHPLLDAIDQGARSNRVAAALSAAFAGNSKSSGLGTFNLRHELFARTATAIAGSSTRELLLGHGTCNGALITATLSKNPDPNRALHDEWLRVLYEWGLAGLALWLWFLASLFLFALRGAACDPYGYAKPLLIYLPAFLLGLTGENMIAGAGNAVSVGFLMLIAFAGIAHRRAGKTQRHFEWQHSRTAALQASSISA